MAPRDRLPQFSDDPVAAPATPVQVVLRRVGTWTAALTMAVALLTLGFMLGGR